RLVHRGACRTRQRHGRRSKASAHTRGAGRNHRPSPTIVGTATSGQGLLNFAMIRFPYLLLLGLAGVLSASAMTAVRLKNGVEIKGDILSEKTDHVVVDLGFTVVTVPRDEIDHIIVEKTPAS